MTKAIDLGTLFAEPELPFGHPGRKFDSSPVGYSNFDDRHKPWPVGPPEENTVHYGHGDRPPCRNESVAAVYTDAPPKSRMRGLFGAGRGGPAGP